MPTIRLVCWSEEFARERAALLKAAGYSVVADSMHGASGIIGHFRELQPDAVVIDLDRLPSHGREIAIVLRKSKSTRHLPIVFAGGAAAKVDRLRGELPDAVFTVWAEIAAAVREAMRHPPVCPVQLPGHMERSRSQDLPHKLGITGKSRVALVGDDAGLRELVGDLPDGSRWDHRVSAQTNLVLYTVRSTQQLQHAFEHAAGLAAGSSLWIVHPKRSGRFACDFNQNDVREAGLLRGWVDYKVCAVDSDWSGLKFARRGALPKPIPIPRMAN